MTLDRLHKYSSFRMDDASPTQTNFEDMFTKLISSLKSSGNVTEVSTHFRSQESIESMFEYLWEFQEAKEYLHITITPGTKNEDEAAKFRSDGNKFYQKKQLDLALQCYNKSILKAPHPKLKSTGEFQNKTQTTENELEKFSLNYNLNGNEFQSLSLGFANRSAVLYELQQYEKCILDCDRSLRCGYPRFLTCKLSERKAKCYLAQRENTTALSIIEECIKDLNNLGLAEDKIKATRSSLDELLEQCSQSSAFIPGNSENSNLFSQDKLPINYLFKFETPKSPPLLKKNAKMPSLSDSVSVAYDPNKGRYLIANRDIQPGEVIVSERSYSSVVLPDCYLSHCSYCLGRTYTPLPCPHCSKVVFCCEDCRDNGLKHFHLTECNLLDAFEGLDLGRNAQLVLRLVIQTTFTKLKDLVPSYNKKCEEVSPELLGFNEEGIYDSKDFSTIYSLVTNKEMRSTSDLFKRTAIAFALIKLLLQGERFFIDSSNNIIEPCKGDIMLIGCTIMTNLMNVPCNAHSITEFGACLSNIQDSVLHDVGAGAYSVLSLCNHSCNPTGARTSFGTLEIFRAITYIHSGNEITDSYGKHYALQSIVDRQQVLRNQYYFRCSCDPCLEYWPLYEYLPCEIRLNCIKCTGFINKEVCTKCNLSYSQTITHNGEDFNYNTVYKQIQDGYDRYNQVYTDVLLGDSSETNIKFLENLLLLCKHIVLPNKVYFEVQETLKHCYDKYSSFYYVC